MLTEWRNMQTQDAVLASSTIATGENVTYFLNSLYQLLYILMHQNEMLQHSSEIDIQRK